MTAEVIDYATGEVITTPSTDLVPADNMAALEALEPDAREVAVTRMLSEARSWLAHAVEATEPVEIANFKARVATWAEATKQLNLSKEIRLDAQEMVRRAEIGVGESIRRGQANGTVNRLGSKPHGITPYEREGRPVAGSLPQENSSSVSVREIVPNANEIVDIYVMADADPMVREQAISDAKSEGNLSRANVVRKIKGQQSFETRDDRAREVARLAALGYSSRQIAPQIGLGQEALAAIVRDYGITVKADRHIAGTHAADTNRIIEKAVSALEGIALGLDLIDPSAIDPERAQNWANSLTQSIAALSKARRQIKESVHVQS